VADLRKVIEEIVREELNKIIQESSLEEAPVAGPRKKTLRRVGGQLKIVKKRKKKLPLHLRLVKPTQAKRIARKSALKRKGKQARITKKAKKTTAKGRKMGLYKNR
jgi:ABC-type phosphate transport system auxiliary subunit